MAPEHGRKNEDPELGEAKEVEGQSLVGAEGGYADENGQPRESSDPSAASAQRFGERDRNCCENKGCFGMFWILLLSFILFSFVLGIATNRPWMGALGVLSLIPAFLILYFVYWRTHRHLVEMHRVINMFCWGIVGGIPCAFLELLIAFIFARVTGFSLQSSEEENRESVSHIVISALFAAFFVAALCEEFLKYYLVVEFPNGVKGAQSAYSVVVLATAGALGFATLENVGYVFHDSTGASISVAIMRAILAVPLHAATGMIIGLNVGQALMEAKRPVIWEVLWLPILLHGTYDGVLMLSVGLKREDEFIGDLGIVAFLIPILALSYATRRIWKLPQDW
eukprot:CAMPEP_0184488218 /NCGR_PEP_ID=MMETSP0113_2-20130426/10599_1 /TAXON_ID=91329 /ORGANISM="Norrisiella sphaerica, Strain BC52" /LENGTH=338 /DNA_ID=CAMNT_0026870727 /DNA_START=177 /DNA_END=1190 /DNA_ORIENTATION=+